MKKPEDMSIEELVAHMQNIEAQMQRDPNNQQLLNEFTAVMLLLGARLGAQGVIIIAEIEINDDKPKFDPRWN